MSLNFVELPVSSKVPRDGNDRPLVIPKMGGKPVPHTRTTTFIDCIEDKSNLTDWGKRMVLAGAAVSPGLVEAAVGLDPKADKRKMDALAEKALERAGGNLRRDQGSHLHHLSEYVDRGEALPQLTPWGVTTEADVLDMAAYKMATIDFAIRHIEKLVVVNILSVAGTPDRVSRYAGPGPEGEWVDDTFITDLKTGNMEYGHLKMASQLAVYSRGEFYDPSLFPAPDRIKDDKVSEKAWQAWRKTEVSAEDAVKAYSPIGEVNRDWGIIMGLEPGSAECNLYWVNLGKGWSAATLALDIRKMRSTPKPMIPFVGLTSAA